MGTWSPDVSGLATIAQLFSEYSVVGANQGQIYARLQQCSARPDFNNYLVHLLGQSTDKSLEIRQSAGLLLKNNLRSSWAKLPPDVQHYVKSCLLNCLTLPERTLRITAGTAVSNIVIVGSLKAWPELCATLPSMMDSPNVDASDGALDALFKICEEDAGCLDHDIPGLPARPAALLVPRLLNFFASPHVQLQKRAVGCINQLVGYMPSGLVPELDRYIQSLLALAMDRDGDIRRLVCQGLVALVQTVPERLQSNMAPIVQYVLARNQDEDPGVALEACDFWCALCETELDEGMLAVLRSFIPQLVPVLLTNMAYELDDEEVVEAEEDELNAGRPDREQDMKPFTQGSRVTSFAGDAEDDDDDGDAMQSWTLRKSSASSLDTLSMCYPSEMLPVLLPIVDVRLRDPDWRLRESAILALGAVAEGCDAGLSHLAPQVIQGLLPVLDDPRPLVRSITCWTLGRYCKWLVRGLTPGQTHVPGLTPEVATVRSSTRYRLQQSTDPTSGQASLDQLLAGLLKRVLDKNKAVQRSACSGLSALLEEAQHALTPRLGVIVQHLVAALGMYQRKAQRSLCEVMSTLANSTGQDLAEPSLAGSLVPPVVAKWFAFPTEDLEQLAVLDCITEIIPALGDSCQTYAPPLFNRCVVMLRQQLHNRQAQGGAGAPEYEPALLAAALSAASALAEALAASIESLAVQSQLLDLVLLSCGDPDASVRQCAFGLLGDLAKSCPSHVLPAVQRCLEACGAVLAAEQHGSEADMRAATNACWAMGELVVRAPAQDLEERFALPLTQVLAQVLSTRSAAGKGMLENAAITLGRLAMRCPQVLAPHAPGFMDHLCTALRRVRDDVEKEQAFAGLCAVVRLNPMGVLPAFVPMANAFASWHLLRDEDLHRRMAEIMRGYKTHLPPDQWASAWGALETPVQTKLTQWFLQ